MGKFVFWKSKLGGGMDPLGGGVDWGLLGEIEGRLTELIIYLSKYPLQLFPRIGQTTTCRIALTRVSRHEDNNLYLFLAEEKNICSCHNVFKDLIFVFSNIKKAYSLP